RLRLVLELPCPQRLGKAAPEAVQAVIGHLQDAADVRGLALVQEQVRAGRVAIDPVAALEEPKCYQRVEEILGRAGVKAQPVPYCLAALRMPSELGEQFH